MERFTTDAPEGNLQTALNLFYAKDGEAWVRGGTPAHDYVDTTLNIYIRGVIDKFALSPHLFAEVDDITLAEIMADWVFDGTDTIEGLIGTLYTAAWAFAEIQARLKAYEDTGLMPAQVAALKAELEDERYRHDRLQDFEVAEAKLLSAAKRDLRNISSCHTCANNGVKCHTIDPVAAPDCCCGSYRWQGDNPELPEVK